MKFINKPLSVFQVLFLFTIQLVWCQSGVVDTPSNFESTSQIFDIIEDKLWEEKIINYDLKNIIGSPFYTSNFIPGKLYFNDKFIGDYFFRYNLYRDEFEIKEELQNSSTESIKKMIGVNVLLFDGDRFSVFNVNSKNNSKERTFLKLIEKGKYSLYKKIWVHFSKPKESENSLSGNKKAKFKKYEEYYLVEEQNKIQKLNLKKNDLISFFNNKEIEVRDFVNNNRLNPKKEKDLKKIIQYINQ